MSDKPKNLTPDELRELLEQTRITQLQQRNSEAARMALILNGCIARGAYTMREYYTSGQRGVEISITVWRFPRFWRAFQAESELSRLMAGYGFTSVDVSRGGALSDTFVLFLPQPPEPYNPMADDVLPARYYPHNIPANGAPTLTWKDSNEIPKSNR